MWFHIANVNGNRQRVVESQSLIGFPLRWKNEKVDPKEDQMEKQPEKVGLIGAISNFFRFYATFSGRSSRSEYWFTWLAGVLIYLLLVLVSVAFGAADFDFGLTGDLAEGVVSLIILATLIVPSLAIMSRRLRDAGISPYFLFFLFLPVLGGLALFVMMMFPSKEPSSP